MGKYHNDQPITGGVNDPDLLNRSNFANNLAEVLLLEPDDNCLTVSLEGEWGYGKTSVINLVKGALQEKEIFPVIVEYNPWLAGQPESLIQDFLLQFSSQLHIRNGSQEALEASKELIAYSSLFSVVRLIPGAEPWASAVEKALSTFSNTAKKLSELQELDLLSRKKKVVEALEKIKTPIIVIIDDIDRLTPSETFQILRLVKAVADFKGTSFLLSFDSNYLTSVLSKNDIANTFEYINKVIQLRVPLPLISEYGMDELAKDEFEKLGGDGITARFEGDQDRTSWIFSRYFKKLIRNPRDLKRLFNHLRFMLIQVGGEVCFSDLLSLSLIATKANSVYEHIKKSPEAYIGSQLSNSPYDMLMEKSTKLVETFSSERNKILETFIDSERKLLNNLLSETFPLLKSEGYRYPFKPSNADGAGHISTRQRLYTVLHYSTPIGYIADQDIISFISGEVNRESFIKKIIDDNAEERFFEMLMNYSGMCEENAFDVLVSIYDIFVFSSKMMDDFMSNYSIGGRKTYRNIEWATEIVISKNNRKYDLIKRLVQREENAPFSVGVLSSLREGRINDQWLNDAEFLEVEKIFQDVALRVLAVQHRFNDYFESHIFHGLKRSDKKKTGEFISKLLDEDNGIVRFANLVKHSGTDSSNGPYAQVNEENFDGVIDFEKIRILALQVNIKNYSIDTQAAIKSIIDGNKYYLRDGIMGEKY